MAKTMKALVMRGLHDVAVMERPIPVAGPNDAIVRTTVAMVCTSDCHTIEGGLGELKDRVLGHEAVGVIHELGSAVKGFRVGQRAAGGGECHHALLQVRELSARLHLPVSSDARRLQVHRSEGRQHGRVLPCE